MRASFKITQPGDVLRYLDPSLSSAFDVDPEVAIAYFKAKGLKPTFAWAEMLADEHHAAFTVAKMMDIDLLATVKDHLETAIAQGQNYRQFSESLIPKLQAAGWWGKAPMTDPLTGQTISAQLGSPARLRTIFRSNLQAAYAAGHWEQIQHTAEDRPYLLYDAIDDDRTRPDHAAWDGTILKANHSWWKTHFPPNGWNCRCSAIQLSDADLAIYGIQPSKAPKADLRPWTNPRTGKTHKIPKGVDPGWNTSPEAGARGKYLNTYLAEKIAALGDSQAKAHAQAWAEKAAQANLTKAKAEGAAALARAETKAAEKAAKAKEEAAQAAAQAEIGAIAKGEAPDPGKFLAAAYKQVSKIPGFKDGTPTEQLSVIKAKAGQLKAKHAQQTQLSGYKKAVLAGKIPTPSQKAAFDKLTEEEKAAFLAKIEQAKPPKPAPAPAEPAAAPKPTKYTPPAVEGPDPAHLTQIGPQKGSNPGGLFQDTSTGAKWYIKQPATADHARNELLAGKLYEAAGVDVPELALTTHQGKPAIASRYMDGLEKVPLPGNWDELAGAHEGFVVDAWLANWDVAGLSYDNLLRKGGKAIRIDVGGSLRYRAQGTPKGDAFGKTVPELETLLDATKNEQSATVFAGISQEAIRIGAKRVAAISDDTIRMLVNKYGPTDPKIADDLAATLIARRDYIKAKLLADEPEKKTPKKKPLSKAAQEAKAAAIAQAKQDLQAAIADLDNKVVTAIKGIASRAAKGAPLRQKDLDRVSDVLNTLIQLIGKHAAATSETLANIADHYSPWIKILSEAVQPGVGKPAVWKGGHFTGYQGVVAINEVAIKYTVPKKGAEKAADPAAVKRALGYRYDSYAAHGRTAAKKYRLDEHEAAALVAYTGNHYEAWNRGLRGLRTLSADEREAIKACIQAMRKMPQHTGTVKRGVKESDLRHAGVLEAFTAAHTKEGATIKWQGFTSTSTASAFSGQFQFTIRGASGPFVEEITAVRGENEVLLMPGTTIKIASAKRVAGIWNIIADVVSEPYEYLFAEAP